MRLQHIWKKAGKALCALILASVIAITGTSSTNAAVLGIDVSKYNGNIDWSAVASSGVSFTFIKAGSTYSGIDPKFAQNIVNAQANGIRTGVYIYSYAMSVEEAMNEALLLLEWIAPYHVNYPVVFDIESDKQLALDAATTTAMCNAFCDVIYSAGYTPMVYTYKNFYTSHITTDLRYDTWIAQYNVGACDIPGYQIWQFSCTGQIPGVAGAVDMDWMVKDYSAAIPAYGFAEKNGLIFFYNDYRLTRGWVEVSGLRFHMDDAFFMNKGWFSDNTGTYFLSLEDGHAYTGLNAVGTDFFYFDEQGRVLNGLIDIAGLKYFFDPNNGCRMHTGWLQDDKGVRFFNPTGGYMATGLTPVGNDFYYFDTNGYVQTGAQKIQGLTFFFDPATGKLLKGTLFTDGTYLYYASPVDGHSVINEAVQLAGLTFVFNSEGHLVTNAQYTIGAHTYVCDPTGVATMIK